MFWESRQAAKKSYVCDLCFGHISFGRRYVRYVSRGSDNSLMVFREHECVSECDEWLMQDEYLNEMVHSEVAETIVMVATLVDVVKELVDGSTVVEAETRFEPQVVSVAEIVFDSSSGESDDIPF